MVLTIRGEHHLTGAYLMLTFTSIAATKGRVIIPREKPCESPGVL